MLSHGTHSRCSTPGHTAYAQQMVISVEIGRSIPTALQIHEALCDCQHSEAHSESRGGARGQGGKRACPPVQLAHTLLSGPNHVTIFPICIIENLRNVLAPVSGHSCLHLRWHLQNRPGLGPVPTGMAPWGCITVSSALVSASGMWELVDKRAWDGGRCHSWLSKAVPRTCPPRCPQTSPNAAADENHLFTSTLVSSFLNGLTVVPLLEVSKCLESTALRPGPPGARELSFPSLSSSAFSTLLSPANAFHCQGYGLAFSRDRISTWKGVSHLRQERATSQAPVSERAR